MKSELYNEFISFFKSHQLYDEKTFNYIRENSKLFDYKDEDKRREIGYYTVTENEVLKKIIVCVPIINDKQTLLINIYVYMHALQLCKQLGKKINKKQNKEVLPMLYEKIYLQENPNEKLEEYIQKLDEHTTEKGSEEELIALSMQEELLTYYNEKKPSKEKLQKKAKRLTRKYRSK